MGSEWQASVCWTSDMRKEPMDGETCGEFVAAAIGMVVVAFVVGLSLAAPWIGGLAVGGLVVWFARGWLEDEQEYRSGS